MKALDKFVRAHFESLINNLNQYHQFQLPETTHRIRVDIKKLKSVLQVMAFSLKKYDSHENYLPLRNIFRKAGLIRHSDVMIRLLIANNLEGLPIAQEDTTVHQEAFKAEIPFYIEQMTRHSRETLKLVSDVGRRDLQDFLRKRLKFIKSRLYPVLKPGELHNVRKSIKQLIYLSGLVDLLGAKKQKFYSRMEDAIGQLHDKEVLVSFLKSLAEVADPQVIKALRKACDRDRKAIAQMARKFYD